MFRMHSIHNFPQDVGFRKIVLLRPLERRDTLQDLLSSRA